MKTTKRPAQNARAVSYLFLRDVYCVRPLIAFNDGEHELVSFLQVRKCDFNQIVGMEEKRFLHADYFDESRAALSKFYDGSSERFHRERVRAGNKEAPVGALLLT